MGGSKQLMLSNKQNGSVLVFCLVLLLALTIVGASGFNRVTIDEKVASNLRDKHVALQKGEIALRAGEDDVKGMQLPPQPSLTAGSTVWPIGAQGGVSGSMASNWILAQTDQWWVNNTNAVSTANDTYFFIEEQEIKRDSLSMKNNYSKGRSAVYYYRITTKAEGAGTGSTVLQSTYGKRFN